MDQTKKPRIVVEDEKGKVEWVARTSPTMSELCKQCELYYPVFPKPGKPTKASSNIYEQVVEFLVDWDDAIVLCDEPIEPTWINLAKSIDSWLLGYFYLQYDLQYGKEISVPDFYTDAVSTLLKYKDRPSKSWRLWAPDITIEGNSGDKVMKCPTFALKAQLTILAQRLFQRRDASKAKYAPEHICCFYNSAMLRDLKKYDGNISDFSKIPEDISNYLFPKKEKYTLEDYILFERVTACSFFIEVAGALSCVEQEQRDICLDVLTTEQNLGRFLSCPYLLTRIAVVRQFIYKTASLLQQYRNTEIFGETLHQTKCQTAQKVLDLMLNQLSPQYKEPACFKEDVECSEKERCRDLLLEKIVNTKAPIDFGEYLKNPVYGPVAFCNPRHDGVGRTHSGSKEYPLLEDVRLFNCLPRTPAQKQPETWKCFIKLCEAAESIH